MKQKIQDIIRGKFESERPRLLLPEELAFSVVENETYAGVFLIESSGEAVRGIVTCPNPHISCQTKEFDGKKAKIRFSYHTGHLAEGATDSGHFVITSSAGEYLLDFRVHITKEYLHTSIGRIKTLNDFTNLSKLSWEEALKVFQSPYFSNIFHGETEFCSLLYRGLTARSSGSREMEEFLIGCGKKRRSTFTVDRQERSYVLGRVTVPDKITVAKSEWGYFEASVTCDAGFVRLSKNRVGMYDFIGKHAEITYEVLPGRMHRGKNFAVITVENCFGKQEIAITASVRGQSREKSARSEKRGLRSRLEQLFLDYRSGAADKEAWGDESLRLLQKIREAEPKNGWYPLFAAYVLRESGRAEDAEKELKEFPKKQQNPRTPLGAFYQYLTIAGEEDAEVVRDTVLTLREVFAKYPAHPVLFWALLEADEALTRNPQRRYHILKEFVTEYSASPVFYLETAKLLWKHPELLHQQDVFERRVVCWMAKKNLLNETLALRILDAAQTQRQFDEAFFQVLCRCHRIVSGSVVVKSICSYLIKMNRYGENLFPWFQRGIEQHLKIAGLYEAYMMSWSRANGALPVEIIKYFSHSSSLPARRKAMLFAYVVRNRERLGKDWDAYMEMVKEFAVRELGRGRMSEDLAIIYEAVKKQVTKDEWDSFKGEAESCYKVNTAGENITMLRVLQRESDAQQRIPVTQDVGYVYLYRRPFVILYEDASGTIYSAKDSFRLRKMISAGEHIFAPEQTKKIPAERREDAVRTRLDRLKSFAGSMREMDELIRQAQEDGEDVLEFQEQLMIRMLFTGTSLKNHEELFRKIRKDPEAARLQDAYVSWCAWRYMTEDVPLPRSAAAYIGEGCLRGKTVNAWCRDAFLRDYAENPKKKYARAAEQVLRENILSERYYDFYGKLPLSLRRRYLLFHPETDSEEWKDTRYGMMCRMMESHPQKGEQYEYARLCDLTEALFLPIKE